MLGKRLDSVGARPKLRLWRVPFDTSRLITNASVCQGHTRHVDWCEPWTSFLARGEAGQTTGVGANLAPLLVMLLPFSRMRCCGNKIKINITSAPQSFSVLVHSSASKHVGQFYAGHRPSAVCCCQVLLGNFRDGQRTWSILFSAQFSEGLPQSTPTQGRNFWAALNRRSEYYTTSQPVYVSS
jgi:hypothetical protein